MGKENLYGVLLFLFLSVLCPVFEVKTVLIPVDISTRCYVLLLNGLRLF